MGTDEHSTTGDAPRYAAFISYAHADAPRAARLHRMLERYRPPPEFKERRERLRPVFRDTAELTPSHSLSDKIKAAVEGSRKLIVLCSPAAKKSHWVNEEIRLFRSLHGEESILCAIVEGVPHTAFPPALTEEGREPLAADLTGSLSFGKGESFRYGVLQLAASMLDVGLDALVRRHLKRRRRVGSAVVLGALAFSGVMGASTLSAVKAREAANANRAEAEDLVEYMITDLKTKLEPVGRLDILDGVGDKVIDYYKGQKIADMPDERIARYARAQHLLGQVALDAGRYEEAKTQIDAAYALTQEVLARNPEDTDAIFAHAQSAYWVGKVFRDQNLMDQIRPHWQEYYDLSYRLYEKDSSKVDWIMEAAWGESNLGLVERFAGESAAANDHYMRAISLFDAALIIKPDAPYILKEKADTITGAEQLAHSEGNYKEALFLAKRSISTLEKILHKAPENMTFRWDVAGNKSDFLWQYSPLLSSADRLLLLKGPLDEFKQLTQHDPENDKWRQDYIWHLYQSLVLSTTIDEKLKTLDVVKDFQSRQDISKLTSRQKMILTLLEARYEWLNGQQQTALNLIQPYNFSSQHATEHASFSAFILAEIYSDFSDRAGAQKYAKIYLEKTAGQTSVKRIDALLRKGKAQSILGECEAASKTIAPILAVISENTPDILEIINCKA